jgi:hypothetical protein
MRLTGRRAGSAAAIGRCVSCESAARHPAPANRAGSGPTSRARPSYGDRFLYGIPVTSPSTFCMPICERRRVQYAVISRLHRTRCAGPLPGPVTPCHPRLTAVSRRARQNALPANGLAVMGSRSRRQERIAGRKAARADHATLGAGYHRFPRPCLKVAASSWTVSHWGVAKSPLLPDDSCRTLGKLLSF